MLNWQRKKAQYSNGFWAVRGTIVIGSVDYDGGCPPKGKPYKATCSLLAPSKEWLGHYTTDEEAKEAVLQAFKDWLISANLEITL